MQSSVHVGLYSFMNKAEQKQNTQWKYCDYLKVFLNCEDCCGPLMSAETPTSGG